MLDYSAVAENYATWKARNFPFNPGDGAPEWDADADGRANLIEYAVGSNPNTGGNPPYMNITFATNAFILSVQKGPGAANDVIYDVEGSPDLASGNWSTSWVTILENSPARIQARYEGTTSNGFLRLKFSLSP